MVFYCVLFDIRDSLVTKSNRSSNHGEASSHPALPSPVHYSPRANPRQGTRAAELRRVLASVDECRAENMEFFESFKEGLKATEHGIHVLRVCCLHAYCRWILRQFFLSDLVLSWQARRLKIDSFRS